MSRKAIDKWVRGDWLVICDICGKKKHVSQTTLSYSTGDIPSVIACLDGCADYRQPLNDPPPLIFDAQPVPDARPDATENNNDAYTQSLIVSSMMYWGYLVTNGMWGYLNNGNTTDSSSIDGFSVDPVWYWGYFRKPS